MRSAILTINGTENYGNVLQNYAVQRLAEELGSEAETVKNISDCQNSTFDDGLKKKISLKYMKDAIHSRLKYKYDVKNTGTGLIKTMLYVKRHRDEIESAKRKREAIFQGFCNTFIRWCEMPMDYNKPWTREQIDQFDKYITGSDQVWNTTNPSGYFVCFLQFAPEGKRIALSPSFGVSEIPEYLHEDYAKWLKGIPYLSVREERGREIIRELCGREAKVLCDPTMALPQEQWIELEKKPAFLPQGEYILTYFLGDRTKKYERYINQIAKRYKLQVLHIYDLMDLEAYCTSPQEFVYLIHHARLVCTDSFHGAAFSIIMNRNFVTFERMESGNMESRISTLLKTYKMENRAFGKIKEDELFNLNFTLANEIRLKKRREMQAFLREALRNETCVKQS